MSGKCIRMFLILLILLQQCKRFCLFDAVLQDCDCFHPLYLDWDGHRPRKAPCDLGRSEVAQCLENIETEFSTDMRRCSCNSTCQEVNYDSVTSSSLWPSLHYEVRFVSFSSLGIFIYRGRNGPLVILGNLEAQVRHQMSVRHDVD